ncbi:MAG: exopolysaccharide biosynthesis polyprenyl glycosylphosphotransferase [Nitrosopumilus sp.]|nr:exopolysaccharide biosynthesis polyprenyl glycosylphosphotransferase [Nitrosopumilus sp.]MBA3551026.1 exopolysaccharide biosynthesis polyprenyl glycosylphosphotransferase [Patescibacteria group bacterium]
MSAFNKWDPFFLFCGDIILFFVSLWITLALRYQALPDTALFLLHVVPFSILFVVWILVLFIAGLYERRTIISKNKLPGTIFKTQLINSSIAVLFFYFIPTFGITPKTILFVYLIVSFILMVLWRIYGQTLFTSSAKQRALLIGRGPEMKELLNEVNANSRYNMHFISSINFDDIQKIDFEEKIVKQIKNNNITSIVVDDTNENVEPLLSQLYNLMFSGIMFNSMHKMYEDIFNRIPLSIIKYEWFLENISLAPKKAYDVLKRVMDVAVALPLGILSLILYPFIYIFIKMEDGGSIFIAQERIGKNGSRVRIYKFRTMNSNDNGNYIEGKSQNKVTKTGEFLRKTRIDELPQLLNVVRGDVSLIGPRPELPSLVELYEQQIPYYGIRHLIKPGLSGWAQIYHDNHPHHGEAVEQTKEKLSYDLYYIKNRSFILDIKIALKTINIFIKRKGI